MGADFSLQRKYQLPEEVKRSKKIYDLLGLNELSTGRLHKVFCQVDDDCSGELSLYELLDHLKMSRTPFSERVFSIFDEDGSGQIDFREFTLSLWNYCTMTKASLIIFAFDMYDQDGSGTMEVKEIKNLCRDVYGNDFEKNQLALQVVDKIDRMNCENDVTVERFANFCETHPALLYPAFSFQQSLQRRIVGKRFWKSLAQKRVTLPTGAQIPIRDLLKAHIDEGKFQELAYKSGHRERGTLIPDSAGVNGDFKDMYNQTGTVARRRTALQKIDSAKRKIHAASILQKLGSQQHTSVLGPDAPHRRNSHAPRPSRGPIRKTESTATHHVNKGNRHSDVVHQRRRTSAAKRRKSVS